MKLTSHDIIRKPVITEKSMAAMAEKKYTFIVHMSANKVQIKKAVEEYGALVWERLLQEVMRVLETDIVSEVQIGIDGCKDIFYGKQAQRYISDKIDRIYVDNLDDLVDLVEYSTGEEIIEVYLDHIITINSDISM